MPKQTYVHMQHNKLDSEGNIRTLYSENTALDVLVNRDSNKVIPKGVNNLDDLIRLLTSDALSPERINAIYKLIGETDISAYGDGSITGALEYIDQTKGIVTTDPTTVGSSMIKDKPLLASKWNGNQYVIKSPLVNASSMVTMMASTDISANEYEAYKKADMIITRIGTRIFTITAMGEVPKIDLPVVFFIGDAVHLNNLPKITYLDVTLNSSDWNANNEIVVEDEEIKTDRLISLTVADNMTAEQYNVLSNACIEGLNTETGRLTLKAFGDKPTIDLPIKIMIGDIISTSDLNANYEELTERVDVLQSTIERYIDNTAGLIFSIDEEDKTLVVSWDDGK